MKIVYLYNVNPFRPLVTTKKLLSRKPIKVITFPNGTSDRDAVYMTKNQLIQQEYIYRIGPTEFLFWTKKSEKELNIKYDKTSLNML